MPTQTEKTVASTAPVIPMEFAMQIEFIIPLWGFETNSNYVLQPAAREGLWWLQSESDDRVTFLLADPFTVDSSYAVDLGDKERTDLQLTSADEALALVMLTLPASGAGQITANFRAPIVFNMSTGQACQVVSRDEQHAVQREVSMQSYRMRDDIMESNS